MVTGLGSNIKRVQKKTMGPCPEPTERLFDPLKYKRMIIDGISKILNSISVISFVFNFINFLMSPYVENAAASPRDIQGIVSN